MLFPSVPSGLNTFIQKELVPKLYQQRKSAENSQFAVLFLGNKNSDAAEYKLSKYIMHIDNNYKIQYKYPCTNRWHHRLVMVGHE